MRVVFIAICAVSGVVAGYALFGSVSPKTYFLERLPAAISQVFFPHDAEGENKEIEIKGSEKTEDVPDVAAIADEEAQLQQSIKSVEDEIRRTEQFLQQKNGH